MTGLYSPRLWERDPGTASFRKRSWRCDRRAKLGAKSGKVVVPEDCVYDRSPTSHAVNLFDIAHKYADVITCEETVALLP